jgi:hypothetical protein
MKPPLLARTLLNLAIHRHRRHGRCRDGNPLQIERRFREIGIRKVLGASLRQLLLLISNEFLRLVLIAFVTAVPLTLLVVGLNTVRAAISNPVKSLRSE